MSFFSPNILAARGTQIQPNPPDSVPPPHVPDDYRIPLSQLSRSVLSDSSQSGGTTDDVVYLSKYLNLVGLIYADNTAAVQAAHDNLPNSGGVLQFPPGTWVIDNAALNKPCTVRGAGMQTYLQPGPSGTIFTSNASNQGTFRLETLCIGEPHNGASPSRSYATPMVDFQNWTGILSLENIYANISDTGLIFRFRQTCNLSVRNCHINPGGFGIPFEFDRTVAFAGDTIKFDTVLSIGRYFAIFRIGGPWETISFDNSKIACEQPAQPILDHSLSADAAAGDSTITLQAGQGASWSVNDSPYIEGNFAADAAQRSGGTAEVNKVTAVNGDVLTLAQPLRFAHGTNGNTFTVQVLRGGVALSMGSSSGILRHDGWHFEGLAWGCIDYGTVNAKWNTTSQGCNRLIRLAGNVQQLTIGPTKFLGHDGEIYMLDLPSWNNGGSNLNSFYLTGPWSASTPNVLDSGASFPIDNIQSGALFRSKHMRVFDLAPGFARTTIHNGAGSTTASLRIGNGTNSDLIDFQSNGGIAMNGGDLDITVAGHGVKVKEGANAKQGLSAAMVAGTVTIANTSVTANSRIQITRQAGGTNPGAVYESARIAGTSFTVTSTNAADTGQVAYSIFEPG